ncbi:MAG: hypothetical protein A2284_06125 [Deltaproteobacteria bacterium RIFOXYA12_FULL_61_11]|nr:MAG: hypothetical protein A2284_06125 [Deltaproteobacteria bacterium RIFOXYA12_FULL_61_11]
MAMVRNRPKFWQRKYIINQGFQVKYIAYVVLASTLISSILSFYIYKTSLANSELLEIMSIQNDLLEGVKHEDFKVLVSLLSFIVLQALCLLVFAVLLTHRIAGPLFRVELFLKAVVMGEAMHVRSFRKGDEFKYLAELMNSVSDFLHNTSTSELAKLTQMRTMLTGQEGHQPSADQLQSTRALIEELIVSKSAVFQTKKN